MTEWRRRGSCPSAQTHQTSGLRVSLLLPPPPTGSLPSRVGILRLFFFPLYKETSLNKQAIFIKVDGVPYLRHFLPLTHISPFW
jgi:hypothetical protein